VRHPDHLRPNLFHRWLFRGTAGLGLANSAMVDLARCLPVLRTIPSEVLPVALEPRFAPGGDREGVRARLGVPADAVVAGTIGKIDGTRGHDVFIRGVAAAPGVWGLIIGKGPGVAALQTLAASLGVVERLAWAGYVEAGLEDLYAAMDLFVFPAAGSDWGHRAIAEASACGLPSLAADLPGVTDLVEPGATGELFAAADSAALGRLLRSWGTEPARLRKAGDRAVAMARARWSPPALVEAARRLYTAARAAGGRTTDRSTRP
jgi:glycosyltransferase involved in cell wall biosynthesis